MGVAESLFHCELFQSCFLIGNKLQEPFYLKVWRENEMLKYPKCPLLHEALLAPCPPPPVPRDPSEGPIRSPWLDTKLMRLKRKIYSRYKTELRLGNKLRQNIQGWRWGGVSPGDGTPTGRR